MATELAPDPNVAPVQASLFALLAPFNGYRYNFLLALIKDPTRSHADVCRELGIEPQTAWNWHSMVPGFKEALEAIKEGRADLRQEYAKLAFEGAIPVLADAMIERGKGTGRDAQRAGERILEAVGVLKKENSQEQAPIQVTTHTYVLVQPNSTNTAQGAIVESSAKELAAPESHS